MTCTVVVGTQWGDEGKGKIVDLLTKDADVVVRYQGGNNAGHTVMFEDKKVVLHLIPSGILQGKISILGNGTVIDIGALLREIGSLKNAGYDVANKLRISSQAHVILPWHLALDYFKENKKNIKIGTTGRGIGPCYSDKISRIGIRIGDIPNTEKLRNLLKEGIADKNKAIKEYKIDYEDYDLVKLLSMLQRYYEEIKNFVVDSSNEIYKLISLDKKIIFEGAQGTFLDIDHGTYPYVTSSNTLAGAACTGSGIGPTNINRVIGITKAYTTRVGSGPFPTEITDEMGENLRQWGEEFGATTGRPRRCGWFDAVLVKRAVQLNGITDIALTKIDVLDNLEEIKFCTDYIDDNGNSVENFAQVDLESIHPTYHVIPGWKQETKGITSYEDLPKNLKLYIEQIERYTNTRVSIISTGPKREETIIL